MKIPVHLPYPHIDNTMELCSGYAFKIMVSYRIGKYLLKADWSQVYLEIELRLEE